MHRWANIQYGSIYRGLQQLTREGLLVEDGEEREGNRPPRTIYRITEQGQTELRNLLRKAWSEPHLFGDPIDMALRLNMILPKDEVISLLNQRLTTLEALQNNVTEVHCEVKERMTSAPHGINEVIADLFEHRRYMLDAEHRWTQHILKRLESGAYTLSEAEIERILSYTAKGADLPPDHPKNKT
jgi:DNA-binding PadR family transcriptional regulator